MKRIGFLSFGHWTPSPQSQTRSASDALLQSVDLAVAAEELGADGAYYRVAELIFDDGDALQKAIGSTEGAALLADSGHIQETFGAKLDVVTVAEETRI